MELANEFSTGNLCRIFIKEKVQGRDNLTGPGADGMIILKQILEELVVRRSTGFNRHVIKSDVWIFYHINANLVSVIVENRLTM